MLLRVSDEIYIFPNTAYTHHTHIQAADGDSEPTQRLIHRVLRCMPDSTAPTG